jgi:serine/threonine protein kinase
MEDLKSLRKIAFQLLLALVSLHKEGIIHADIKPENCLLNFPSSLFHSADASNASMTSSNPPSSSSETLNPSFESIRYLRQLPPDFEIKLTDFGNSIHVTEISQYFQSFEIQSLPYRAPEVLIGIPFQLAIDLWSLGVLLLELCTGKLFITPTTTERDRKEVVYSLESKLGKLSRKRFSGGKFSDILFEEPSSRSSYLSPSASTSKQQQFVTKESSHSSRMDVSKSLKRYLSKHVRFEGLSNYEVNELIDFLAGFLILDPSFRISAKEALHHSLLAPLISIPFQLFSMITQNEKSDQRKKRIRSSTTSSSSSLFTSLNNPNRLSFASEYRESPLERLRIPYDSNEAKFSR